MDKKTKILIILFLATIFAALLFSYKKYFLEKAYLISAEIPCDPSQDVCYIGYCDTETEECEDEIFYYKRIEGMADTLPDCDPNYDDCPLLWCGEKGNNTCTVIPCDSEAECSLPENFVPVPDEESIDVKATEKS